jgi:peptidoglycan/xylan/chitin deacetylase (PgdA/CDA1 family)
MTACVLAAGLLVHAGGPQPPAASASIALTFDDLPVHGPLPPGLTRVQVARSIVESLTRHGVPQAYGFVNARPLEEDPSHAAVLRVWRDAGYPLGNHAYSHMDLHANGVDSFERDVLANEPALRTYAGTTDWHWFRFPYLREGDTPEKYAAVRALLATHRYRVAQVSVSFDDYAYNDPYVRCLAAGDRAGGSWLEQSYAERAVESLTRGQDAAQRIFGRDIKHVMLLHVGAFQTVMLPRLLDLLRDRGFSVVTLEEAQADDAYRRVPDRAGPRAGTFLEQLEARPTPAGGAGFFPTIQTLCRK